MQKVLMIDDAKALHALVKVRLAAEEVEFHSALGGEAGLELAARVRPDVILLDVEMPAPNGFEVCRRLKENSALSSIPVIFLTGATSSEEKVKGLDLGAADYVTKPFDAAELQARVRASLRTKFLMDLLATTARVDGLTGLWNRSYLDERMAAESATLARHGGRLGCVMADIDHFKSLNDRFGHRFGDTVLRGVAEILKTGSRTEDVVCRYGGEEFAVLTPGVEGPGVEVLAERLRAAVRDRSFHAPHGGEAVRVTCSFGVSDAGAGVESLMERADKALYASKGGGRDRVSRAAAW